MNPDPKMPSTTFISDDTNTRAWATKTLTYNDEGELISSVLQMDDGNTRTVELGEQDGVPVWITTKLSANPSDTIQKIEKVKTLDGDLISRSIENNDGSSNSFSYDSSSALISLKVLATKGLETSWTYEGGVATKRVQTDVSDGNTFDFENRTTWMDGSGAPERMIVNKDSGITRVVDYDLSGKTVSHIRLDGVHYDNAGADTGEFVQIRVTSGFDISEMAVELLDGTGGTVYDSAMGTDLSLHSSNDKWDYYRWAPTSIIDSTGGVALGLDGVALTTFSYEGSFEVQEGIAAGTTTRTMEVYQDGTGTPDDVLTRNNSGTWQGGPTLNAPDAVDDVIAMSDSAVFWQNQTGHLFLDNGNGLDLPFIGYTGSNPFLDGGLSLVAINGLALPASRNIAISTVDGSSSAFTGTMHVNTDGTFYFNELNETQPGGLTYAFEFTYTVENEFGAQDTATATVTYATVNDAPRYTGPDDFLVHETAEPVPLFQLLSRWGNYLSVYDPENDSLEEITIASLPTNGTIIDENGAVVSIHASFSHTDMFGLRFVPNDVTGDVDSSVGFWMTDEHGAMGYNSLDIRVTDDFAASVWDPVGDTWDLVAGGSGDENLPPAGDNPGFDFTTYYGSAGDDTLTSADASTKLEVFDGGSGDDTIILNPALNVPDVLIFRDGTGTDTVVNTLEGKTVFDLQEFDFTTKQDVLDAATQVGDDLHIALDLDDTLILQDRDISFFDTATSLTANDVIENGVIFNNQVLLLSFEEELIEQPILIE